MIKWFRDNIAVLSVAAGGIAVGALTGYYFYKHKNVQQYAAEIRRRPQSEVMEDSRSEAAAPYPMVPPRLNRREKSSKFVHLEKKLTAMPRSQLGYLQDLRLISEDSVSISDQRIESEEYKIPHLSDWVKPSWYLTSCPVKSVDENCLIAADVIASSPNCRKQRYFLRAGPREQIMFHPLEVRAAIATCGGICPGLNTVVRELVMSLRFFYGVRDIFGVQYGYSGFYSRPMIPLEPSVVADIHNTGGTILGTSRGGFNLEEIMNAIEKRGLNMLFVCGGDGTHRGAQVLHEELIKRKMKVAIVGICKTIDNDIPLLDRTFGFDTAVELAVRACSAAHVEIKSVQNGVGLVKLMGRHAGYIAVYACLSSRDVNVCLIPEVEFALQGENGLLSFIRDRVEQRGHCLIVVAEGAGQSLVKNTGKRDPSGNVKLADIGEFLKGEIVSYFEEIEEEITFKYIDPSYLIRSVPANATDNVYCAALAQNAVHGAMAGFTGFSVGKCHNQHVYFPIEEATKTRNVDPMGSHWQRLLASTGQADFAPPKQ